MKIPNTFILVTLAWMAAAGGQNARAGMIAVTSTADSGLGSLRAALALASNGDTINITAKGVITLTSGELVVNKSLTVRGPVPQGIVSGNGISRVFHIVPGTRVTFERLTITNGVASIDPNAFPNNAGGGIYLDHAELTLNSCTVRNNVANLGAGIFSNSKDGGNASLTVNNSTISNNVARATISYMGARGGAIFSGGGFFNTGPSGNATLTVNKSTISDNSAESHGGAIFNDGFAGAARLTITDSVISGNTAADSFGDYAFGGGIYNNGETGLATVTLTNSTLTRNSASTFGGAIHNNAIFTGQGPLILGVGGQSIGGSAVDYQVNLTAGQEYVIIEDATPVEPGENFDGIVAVIDPNGNTILDQDTYVDEVVTLIAPITGQYTIHVHPFFSDGIPTEGHFGLHIYTTAKGPGTANMTFNNCTISGNSISNGQGAGIFSATYGSTTTLVTLTKCVVTGNSAGDAEHGATSGGIHFQGEVADGKAKLTLISCVVKNNFAESGPGGIEIKQALAQLTDTEISDNSTGDHGSGGGLGIDDGLGFNGVSEVSLTNCRVTGNSARNGGGIETTGLKLDLMNCTISGNSAHFGGGIFNENGDASATVRLENSTVSGNSAPAGGGGGIFNGGGNFGFGDTATVILINSTVSGNSAQFGGGILNESAGLGDYFGFGDILIGHGVVILNNSTMSGNSANSGGGIFTWGSNAEFGISSVNIANSVFNAGSSGQNLVAFEDGIVISLGYNVSSDSAGGDGATAPGGLLNRPGDIRNTNPLLGPLKDNGGPTMTHALLDHSPAINAGDPNFNPYLFSPPLLYDQRGTNFARIVGGRVDIGAYEAKYRHP